MQWLMVPGAYLLGSVSFSYLIVRKLQGRDVRTLGSHNAGATNVLRVAGRRAGLAALALDVGKGALAVTAARLLELPSTVVYASASAAVVGHIFPLFLGFRGGKGVATGAGTTAVLAPLPTILAAGAFALVVWRTGYVALGSVTAAAVAAPLVFLCGRLGWTRAADPELLVTVALIGALIIVKHAENLRRLRAGCEPRLGGNDEVEGHGR